MDAPPDDAGLRRGGRAPARSPRAEVARRAADVAWKQGLAAAVADSAMRTRRNSTEPTGRH